MFAFITFAHYIRLGAKSTGFLPLGIDAQRKEMHSTRDMHWVLLWIADAVFNEMRIWSRVCSWSLGDVHNL
jgi:hypothetical protein